MKPESVQKNKKKLLLTLFLSFMFGCTQAQDPVFSQFFASPLQLNPALTGTAEAPVFHLNYRNQWPLISQAYATYAVSYSQLARQLNSGFGVSVLADVAGNGIYNSTQIGLSYAYDLRFNKDFYFRTGIEAAFVNKKLSWDRLIFLDQLDPETGAYDGNGNINPSAENRAVQNINYFDFGFGGLVHTRYFYGGAAIKHINAPKEGFLFVNNHDGELPLRYTLHFGGQIPLGAYNKRKKEAFLSPNVLFTKQRQFNQLNIGTYAQYDSFFGGIWFRHTFTNADAVILMAGFEKKFFKLAYSYDLTVSRLGINSGGAHEISLILNFEPKNKGLDYNDCLNLFR